MKKELKASKLIKLSKNTNLSIAVLPGSDTSAVEPHPSHINVSKGAQYSLTDAVTGRIVHPRKIVRAKKNLEITLLDGTVVHLDDFFTSLEGQDGVNQAQADFVFSTEEGGLQYWNISDAGTALDASSLHAGVEEAVTLWSHDSTMNMSQWWSVAPYEASKISADGHLGISVVSVLGAFLVSSIGVIEAGDPVVKTGLTEPAKPVPAQKIYVVEGTIGAGPVLATNDLSVTLYDETGKVLGTDRVVEAGGKYRIELPSEFSGRFILKVSSTAAGADYQDEATNAATNLATFTLLAVTLTSGGKDIIANISPLTDLAARKLTSGDALKTGIQDADIQAINSAIAQNYLGVTDGDITTQEIQFTVTVSGEAVVTSNRYAQALKALSVVAADNGGSVENAQAAINSAITWQPGQTAAEVVLSGEAAKVAVTVILAANTVAIAAGEPVTPSNTFTPSQVAALTPAQLAALTDTQMAAMAAAGNLDNVTPAQVALLPASTIDLMPAAVMATLTVAQVGALTPAQLAALTDTQMAAMAAAGNLDNVTPAQVALLPAATIDLVPVALVAALTVVQVAALTEAQVAALTPAQLAALTDTQMAAMAAAGNLDNVTTAQVATLPAATIDSVPAAVVAALTDAQVAALTPAQLAALTDAQMAAMAAAGNLYNVTTQQVALLPASTIELMPAAVMATLTDAQVAALTPAQLAALTDAQVAAMAAAGNLENVTPAQVALLPAAAVSLMPAAVVAALTDAQVAALSDSQFAALTDTQMAAMAAAGNLDNVNAAQIALLPAATIDSVPAAVVAALSDAQVAALTPVQLAALTDTQMAAMAAAGNLDNVAPAQVATLPAATIDLMPVAVMATLTDAQVANFSDAQLLALTEAQKVAMSAAGNLDDLSPAQLLLLAPANTAAVTAIADDSGTVTGLVVAGGITNDTSLVVSGTLVSVLLVGESVRIYDGSTFVGVATVAAGASTWAFLDPRSLTHAQTVNYIARVANAAGIQSAVGASYSASVDTAVADAGSITLSLDIGSNSGLTSDNLTHINTPVITLGNLQGKPFVAGDVIQIIDTSNNNVVGSYTVLTTDLDSAGQWVGTSQGMTVSVLADGVHGLTVRVVDPAGNASMGNVPVDVTIDTSAPLVSTVGISSATGVVNKTLNVGDIAHITVNLTKAVIVTGFPKITLIIGITEVQAQYNASLSTSTSMVFDYMVVLADNDSNGIAIKANSLILNGGTMADVANNPATLGHIGVAGNANYLVNSNGPTLTLNPLAGDNQVNASEKAGSVLFNGLTSAEEGQTVTVLWGGVSKTVQVTSGAWQVSFLALEVPADTPASTVTVSVNDLAGNPTQISRSVVIDTALPTLAFNANLTQGAGIALDVDNILNAAELQLIQTAGSWTIEGTSSGAPDGQTVALTLYGQSFNGSVSGNTWQIPVGSAAVQSLVHGNNYTLTAVVSDAAGNAATPVNATLQVRLAPPDTPTINTLNTNTLTPTLGGGIQKEDPLTPQTYIALDDGDAFTVTVGGQSYSLTVGAGAVSSNGPLSYSTSSKTWSLSLPSGVITVEGAYNVGVSVNAVGYSAPKVDISSNELVIKTSLPVLSINTVAGDDRLNALEHNGSVMLTGTAQDLVPGGTSNTAVARSLSIGLNGQTYAATVQADSTWSTLVSAADIQALSDGNAVANISYTGLYGNTATTSKTVEVDTQAPILSLTTPADILLNASELAAFSMAYSSSDTLSTPVVTAKIVNALNVVQTDVSLSTSGNAITGDLSSLSDGVYTVQASSTDAAGNITLRTQVVTIDTSAPTATIALADSALKVGETSLVTITFSRAVIGFSNDDLTAPNGTLSTVASSDGGVTWTATFTPTASLEDTSNAITLATSYTDVAGNTGTVASSANFSIDTSAPTATIALADSALKVGETSLVTITFSEAVTGFSNADLTAPNGALSTVASTDGGLNWTATFTPTASLEDTSNAITLATSYTDVAGNAGTSASSANFSIDTSEPMAPVIDVVATDDNIDSSEVGTLLTGTNEVNATVELSVGGNVRAAVVIGTTWSYTLTPADITAMGHGPEILSATQTDSAGNESAPITRPITLNTAPVLTAGTLTGFTEDTFKDIPYADLLAAANAADSDTDAISFRVEAITSGTLQKRNSTDTAWEAVTPGVTTLAAGEKLQWKGAQDANGSVVNAFTVSAYDGTVYSATAVQVSTAVTAVNDAPVLSGTSTLAYTENDAAAAINTTITVSDVDNVTLTSGTVSITGGFAASEDELSFDNVPATMGNIASTYDSATGVMTLTSAGGTATLLQWQAAFRAVQYSNSSENPSTAARTVSYVVGDGTANATAVTSTVNVTALNDAPTLTSVATLTGFTEDTFKDITYADLVAAANEADVDGDALSFRVETVTTGTLQKWDGSTWVAVVPGTTTIAAGEKIQWKGAANANGSLNAFTVKAYDGTAYSATAVQVSTGVAAVDGPVQVLLSTPLSIVPLESAAGGWTQTGSASSSNNTLQLATTTASTLTTSILGTVSQINRIEMIVNVPGTTQSYNGVKINVGSSSFFIGAIWQGSSSTYSISQPDTTTIYKNTGISTGQNIYLRVDFNSATGVSELKYGTDATIAAGSWISTENIAAPTQGSSANISVGFKKYTEAAALTVSKFVYYVDGTVLAPDNIINLTGTLSTVLASGKEIAVYAVALDGTVSKVNGAVSFTGLSWSFIASAAITASNYQLRIVNQDTGTTSLNTASTVLLSTQSVIAADSAGAIPAISTQTILVDQNLVAQSAVSTVTASVSVADQTLKLKGTLSANLKAGEQLWLYDDSTPLSEIRTTSTDWSYSTPTLGFAEHKLNVKIVNLGTGLIDYQGTNLNISVQNINSPVAIKDDFGVAQTSNLGALTGYTMQRAVTQVMPSLSGWIQTLAGGSITATSAGWIIAGTDSAYKSVLKTIGNSDHVTEVVMAFKAPSTTLGSNGVSVNFTGTSLFYGSQFNNNNSTYTYNGGTGPASPATVISAGNLAYLKFTKTTVLGNTFWQFANSTDGITYSLGNTLAWAANTNITLAFQKYSENANLTVQGIKYQQQSLLTDDTTPTLSGLLDGNMASGEELAIYSTTNSLGTGVASKLGVAMVNSLTREWTFTPTIPLDQDDYVFTPVIQTVGNTSISNANVVYANKLVNINANNTGLPAVSNYEVTISGADFIYDLTAIAAPTQTRVDKIDLTGSGNNKLVMALADVSLAGVDVFTSATGWTFTSSSVPASLKQMLITGNAGDVVQVLDGSWTANGQVSNSGVTYNVYQDNASLAQLLLSQNLTRSGTII